MLRALRLAPLAVVVVGCEPASPVDGGSIGGNGGAVSVSVTQSSAEATTTSGFGATSGSGETASGSTGSAGMCANDDACPAGKICTGGICVDGCNPAHACAGSDACCNGECVDLASDVEHCGACDVDCTTAPNIAKSCNGMCQYGACDAGYEDCDGVLGCEHFGACLCTANMVEPCYPGPPGTENIGACTVGARTCNAMGTAWGACLGSVVPDNEICGNGIDEDCNGAVDDSPDLDGDGWTRCEGDCCDEPGAACSNPALVNPGAFEAAGNMVDDDCDGSVDNVLGACDGALMSNSANGFDYAAAIDLCQTTVETPADPSERTWGVIAANLLLASGAGSPNANSRSIRPAFGPNVLPKQGTSLAVLSSGSAAAPGQVEPSFATLQEGQDMLTSSSVPGDWLALNGGTLPNTPGCPAPNGGPVAHDSVMLQLRVRVPSNAQSFSVSSVFYSSEYPEWVCSPYNDFFVALLDSSFVPQMGQLPNPTDKNLAFYSPGNGSIFPVGVNLAHGNTGLFRQCENGATGCQGVPGVNSSCTGTAMLTGTGYDIQNPFGHCGAGTATGGATGWLTTSGNVTPGEIILIRFSIWDTSDHIFDSTVLLDDFQWSVNSSTPGTRG